MKSRSPPLNPDDPSTFGLVKGSECTNPFDPPEQMPAHAASVVTLALTCQRKRKEKQTIAEVGVWQGILSRWLLVCLPFATVHLIDPWKAADPGSTWLKGDRFSRSPQQQHEANFELVAQLSKQFSPRAIVHRDYSLDAVQDFSDGSLDLVFIDGAHDYQNVKADILSWYPKVRAGGFLSFHDYRPVGLYFGLIPAVHDAVKELRYSTGEIECLAGKVGAIRKRDENGKA